MSFLDSATQLGDNFATKNGSYTSKNISQSPADHTYIGRVVDKETYKDTYSNQTLIKRWLIAANGKSYYVNVENADIKSVGQSVRLYIPNNNKDKAFAEVINPATAPDKIVYKENDKDYDDYKEYGVDSNRGITKADVTVDSMVTTWNLADKTELNRVYLMTVANAGKRNEDITSLICPDGKQIALDGVLDGLKKRLSKDNVKVNSAVRDLSDSNKGKVTISYDNGDTYLFECDREETDTRITLTNISEYWNGEKVTDYD